MYFVREFSLPVAEELGSRGINLPSYPDLNETDVEYITTILSKYFF
jgi:perosamine synthetase